MDERNGVNNAGDIHETFSDLVGAEVEVRSRFEGVWCQGFEIAEVLTDGDYVVSYRVRRISDGQTLPAVFSTDEVDLRQ